MKLRVLTDNNTLIDQYLFGEPAVSYYIEDDDSRILFDTGYTDVFMRNAETLGIDLGAVGTIVLSHGHNDHTRGLKYFLEQSRSREVTVIAHPEALAEKVFEDELISAPFSEEELAARCHLVLSKAPVNVSKHLVFLGEIPQSNSFEPRKAIGLQTQGGQSGPDYVMDDSALVYRGPHGIYIITGCSHSGICNIVEQAVRVCGDERVLGIIGGFHLFEVNQQVHQTIEYLKAKNIPALYPCHCTSFAVRAEIHKALPVSEVGVGLELHWL